MTTPWAVPKDWVGETVAILASGPSMSMEVAEAVRGKCRVIAINDQGISVVRNGVRYPALAPWADVLYAADLKWWEYHWAEASKFRGLKLTVREHLPYPEVRSLRLSTQAPFDPRPAYVYPGSNSGYQALHVAVQRGATKALLCGFDMREVSKAKHWFGDHPGRLNTTQPFRRWIRQFEQLAYKLREMEVEVLNCTPGSALRGFPQASLEEVI